MCVCGERGEASWMEKERKTQAERRGEGECGIVLSDTKGGEKRVKRKGGECGKRETLVRKGGRGKGGSARAL